MTTIKITVPPDQTPEEEAELVARVAAAICSETGDQTISFELVKTEEVKVEGTVADRMMAGGRWNL
jgi:phenylpyruvate tautomerase PptA (4-oxalocrotonate tautomerase family)